MIKEVSNKIIYNDFINKTTLTDDEKKCIRYADTKIFYSKNITINMYE